MPTTNPRITITATGDIAHILDVESRLHPDLPPSALVALLIKRGHAALTATTDRAELVRKMAGGVSYPTGYLDDQRADWAS